MPFSCAPTVGNGRAVACSAVFTSAGVSAGLTASISATEPATMGVAKLVPRDASSTLPVL